MSFWVLLGFQNPPTYTNTLREWAYHNGCGIEYEYLKKYDSKYNMHEACYNHLEKSKLAKWARVNGYPILNSNEIQILQRQGYLPPEYISTNMAWEYETHLIKVFIYNNEDPLLTRTDRNAITVLFDFYEIEGVGLTEPPKETPGLDLLRSGEACKKDNHDLRRMVLKIYTHLKTWINTTDKEGLKQRQVGVWLSDAEKIYFMNGPSPAYIV